MPLLLIFVTTLAALAATINSQSPNIVQGPNYICTVNSLFELRRTTDTNLRAVIWNNQWDESTHFVANCTFDNYLNENTSFAQIYTNNTLALYINCANEGIAWSTLKAGIFSNLHDLVELGFWNCKFKEWTISKWLGAKRSILSIMIINANMMADGPVFNNDFYSGTQLVRLEVSNSFVLNFPTKFLCQWKRLRFLNLHGNKFVNFTSLAECNVEAALEIQNTRYFTELQEINLEANNLTTIPEGIFNCGSDKLAINLRQNNIAFIANLPRVIYLTPTFLELQNNQIKTLYWNCDLVGFVFELHFSNNQLEKLDTNFKSCIALKNLWLDGNQFMDILDILPKLMPLEFIYLVDLSNNEQMAGVLDLAILPQPLNKLLLSNSAIQSVMDSSNGTLSTHLFLETLIADNNTIGDLNHFLFPQHLKKLSLSKNFINVISQEVFRISISLENVDLSQNNISCISGLFEHLVNLNILNLSRNSLSEFDYSYIPLTLLTLDLSYNNLNYLSDQRYYISTKKFNLEVLNISGNYLKILNSKSFPPSLNTIVLTNSEIKIGQKHTFAHIKNLQSLELANVVVHKAELFFFGLDKWKRTITLTDKHTNTEECPCNVYENIDFVTCKDVRLKMLILQRDTNLKNEANSSKCSQLVYCFCDVCSMRYVFHGRLSNTVARTIWCTDATAQVSSTYILPLKARVRHDLRGTTVLYLNNSGIRSLDDGAFENFSKLTELDLHGNQITIIRGAELKGLNHLQKLYMNNNLMTRISRETFSHVRALTELYLDYNRIKSLDDETFSYLPNLRILSLHANGIANIDSDTFISLHSLQYLTLHDNNLDSFLVHLPHNLSDLTLRNNMFPCICDFVQNMQSLMKSTLSNVLNDTTNIYCRQPNFKPTKPIIDMLLIDCFTPPAANDLHKYLIAFSVCVIIIVASGIAIYIFRREAQVWLYSRFKIRLFQKDTKTDSSKDYDVFMSYSDTDREFVFIVVQRLEFEGLRVCVHERDFPVGEPIIDSITSAVERSCRTLIVLTPEFVASEWCLFEFQVAHCQSLQDKCCRIVIIMLEDVDRAGLNPELRAYLRTRTYLKSTDPLFWERLFFSLPDPQHSL